MPEQPSRSIDIGQNIVGSIDRVLLGAKTVEETTELIEPGFDYVTEMNGVKLFRKRK